MTDLAVRPARDGSASGPQVVLVHGALDRAANFERVRRALPELPVVAYDRRGYAGSRGLAPAGALSRHVADLLDVCAGRPTVLIGHSFGGLVALGAAVQEPEQMRAVGVYEPPMPWLERWPPTPDFTDPAEAAEMFFRRMVGADAWEQLPDRFRSDRRAEGAALMADYASADAGLDFALADVLSPVSAAHGSATTEWFMRSARLIAEEVHGARLTVLEGAAHGAHMSRPDDFAGWIRIVVAEANRGHHG